MTKKIQQKKWSVYLIRCADNSIYCGISNDINRRFKEHQSMGNKTAKYLRGKDPLMLAFHQPIGDRSLASQVESIIKSLSKTEKEEIIKQQDLSLFIEIPD